MTETEADQEGYAIISGNEGVIYGVSRLEARFQNIPPATVEQWVIVLWIEPMVASALGLTAILTGKRRGK